MAEATKKLINKAIKGHESSQHQLYVMYYGYCISIALRFARYREDAQDIVHDAFVKVLTKLESFDQTQPFKSWIRRIVVNVAIDRYRRDSRQVHSLDVVDDESSDFTENALDRLSADEILEAIATLPPAYRMVFTLYAIEGFKHDEIAQKLGISVGSSKSNLSKARGKLRKLITDKDQRFRAKHG